MQAAEPRRSAGRPALNNALYCISMAALIAALYVQGRDLASLDRRLEAMRGELADRGSGQLLNEVSDFSMHMNQRFEELDRRVEGLESSPRAGSPGGGPIVASEADPPIAP